MNAAAPRIVFLDNLVHRIFKTVEALRSQDFSVQVFSDEQSFLDALENEIPDILFLNLDLTPDDAVIVTREIRKKFPLSPPFIIIYSDKQDDFVQELAFNSGADSFINFHGKSSVMKVFIINLLKRKSLPITPETRRILIDTDKYVIYQHGEALQLPRKEFRLFELLYNNSDRFFSKPEIADLIWHDIAVAKKRAIDVHIYNIRQIFGKRVIQSQKGKGYRINRKLIE